MVFFLLVTAFMVRPARRYYEKM